MTVRPGTGSHNRAAANPGVLYFGDVGYNTWEELSIAPQPAMNFGWPIYEGFDLSANYLGSNPADQDAPNPLYGSGGLHPAIFYVSGSP